MLYDNETEAMLAIALASKSAEEWIVEFLKQVIYEFGYCDLKVAIRCDGARQLQ